MAIVKWLSIAVARDELGLEITLSDARAKDGLSVTLRVTDSAAVAMGGIVTGGAKQELDTTARALIRGSLEFENAGT